MIVYVKRSLSLGLIGLIVAAHGQLLPSGSEHIANASGGTETSPNPAFERRDLSTPLFLGPF